MILGIAFAVLTGVIWTLVGVIYSHTAGEKDGFSSFMMSYFLVYVAIAWIFRTPQAAPTAEVLRIALVILPASIFGQLGFLALYRAMRTGPHGIAWSISQAAMVLPFLAGWLGFGNPVRVWQPLGMLLVLGSLPLLGKKKRAAGCAPQPRREFLLWTGAAFVLIGLGQVFTLLPNELGGLSSAALSWRVPLNSLGGLWWGAYIVFKGEKIHLSRLRLGLIYGVVVALGQIALYVAIDNMSAAQASEMVYPLAIGCCIVFFYGYCRVVRKEPSAPADLAGLAMLVPGLFMIVIK